ncbi:GGDEF domain-containing protein [Salinisphaera hydrothermalis]|uniref:GGDEF domain-containing protein n=1 Tax=Salinisphaera hydrothermalis TaxID=563188 RepID=UPI0033403D2F
MPDTICGRQRGARTKRQQALVILFGYMAVPLSESLYVWMLAIPVVSYILLGQWLGFAVTVVFFALAVGSSVIKLGDSHVAWEAASLNLAVCFISVAGLAHVYEVVRANTERQLRASALRDSLTGTFNRTGLNVRFDYYEEAAADVPAALGLILLDLDHFKRVNDTHGHHAGDRVLRRVARCIDTHIESGDTAGRLGGEEFVVLLPDRDLEQTRRVAERIRYAIASSHGRDKSRPIEITATLGVAVRHGGESLDTLLARADARLYCGKLNNRDQVVSAVPPDADPKHV